MGCDEKGSSHPPIKVFYYHYHNSIRSELDVLSKSVMDLESSTSEHVFDRLAKLKVRVAFLERVYSIHSSVEDEVVYPALDSKVRNVTVAYSVEHEDEERLFEQLSQLINAAMSAQGKQRRGVIRQLVCKVQEIQTTLLKHLAKEEEQLFPLLLQHFTYSEQAQLVAQLLCCIPLTSVAPVMSWLTSGMPQCEQEDLLLQVQEVVPDNLLLQLLVAWLSPGLVTQASTLSLPGRVVAVDVEIVRPWKEGYEDAPPECCRELMGLDPCGCPLAKAGTGPKSAPAVLDIGVKDSSARAPLQHIAHVHAAIRSALDAFAAEAAALSSCDALTPDALSVLAERLRFLRAVCTYHSASEDDVVFPAARQLSSSDEDQCLECQAEHENEGLLLEDIGRLLGDVRASARRGAQEVAGLLTDLCSAVDATRRAIKCHMEREEADVLPLLQARLCASQQRDMVWRTLCAMPLRLLERVLPWLAGKLTEEEARAMLQDWELAAPADDGALVGLLSRWATRGRQESPEPQDQDNPQHYCNSTCGVRIIPEAEDAQQPPAKRVKRGSGHGNSGAAHDVAERVGSGALATTSGQVPAPAGRPMRQSRTNPIDHIFQFHKALRRDLHALEDDARAFAAELEEAQEWGTVQPALQQLEGRFRCLEGMYKAHSQAEDEIIFPALEGKEALSNVSHAYTLDHQQEAELFRGLDEALAAIRASTTLAEAAQHAARLQRLTAATRASLEQHVRGEEQELWPLFAEYFTEAEQDHLVGVIIGRTGAEVLQAMLPWVTESFTEGEQRAMMDSLRSATRNTGFERWLDATLRPRDSASSITGESPKAPTDADSPKAAAGSDAGSSGHGSDAALVEVAEYLAGSKARQGQGAAQGVFRPGWEDIFRMNQKTLEEAVRRIGSDEGLDAQRKAYLMQNIMASRYIVAQQRRMQGAPAGSTGDRRCFHDATHNILGCAHYKRRCQVVAPCCGNVYPCKKCHDAEEDHVLEAQKVEHMVCMACNLQQPSAGTCSGCGAQMARYYCNICHLWDDQAGRSIYHCPFCNLCRVGEGLGVDACHCMDCNTCMHLSEFATHKCRGLSSCPVCTEPLFESSQPYRELPCGHFMHSHCFAQYTRYNYTCPICAKSMGDMSVYFGMLDSILAKDVCDLPTAYASRRQVILCNDCSRQGEAPFHFVYHKCSSCRSYNTRVLWSVGNL